MLADNTQLSQSLVVYRRFKFYMINRIDCKYMTRFLHLRPLLVYVIDEGIITLLRYDLQVTLKNVHLIAYFARKDKHANIYRKIRGTCPK